MQLNFETYSQYTHRVVSKPVDYDSSGVSYQTSDSAPSISQIPIRESPNKSSDVVSIAKSNSVLFMQREWATGNNKWAFVRQKDGQEGYVMTKYVVPIPAYKDKIQPKSNVSLKPMTQMAKVLFEAVPWMENEFPVLHTENGEWWVTVTLPYTCLAEGTLPEKEQEAKKAAIVKMFQYLGIHTGPAAQNSFVSNILTTYVKDYYLSSRPGSNLMMLVVIPDVYVEYIKKQVTPQAPEESAEEFCVSLEANSLDDLNDLKSEIKKCLTNIYQKYLNSNLSVGGFNFENEIFKQLDAIEKIKFLLKENDINLESISNKTSGEDSCEETEKNRTIKVCFNSEYKLNAVYYYNNSGKKFLLSSGLSVVKNSYPFNEPRFGLMFLKHKEICSMAPTLKTFFKDYVTDPQPEVTTVTWAEKSQHPLSSLASAELQVFIDTALFLTGLAKEFGNLYDLKSAEGILSCYGDPSQSKLVQAYKLKAAEFRDSQIMYTGDIVNIASWICNLSSDDFEEFGDMDWEQLGEDIFGTPEGWKEWWESMNFDDWNWPTFSFLDQIAENAEKLFEEAKDAIKKKFLDFFSQLYCELLLVASAAAAAGIGYGIYLAIKEDKDGNIASSFPSPAETASFDYGSENVNDMLEESLGSKDYDVDLEILFQNCGVNLGPSEKPKAREYLDSISSMLAPVEVLSLLEGTAPVSLTNLISKHTQANFPEIHQHKNTSSKIADFFVCLGGNVTQESKAKVQQKIIDKISNLDICVDICEELKKKMQEKCPDPAVYNAICEKEFNSKIEKYQEIIALINDDCSMQPKFFNNSQTGEKGIFSSPENQPQSTSLIAQKLTETALNPPLLFAEANSSEYFVKYGASLEQVSEHLMQSDLFLKDDKGSSYHISKNSGETPLLYRLFPDGTEIIETSLGFESDELPSINVSPLSLHGDLQTIMQDNTEDMGWDSPMSRHQMLFYSLVQDYFKNNSKNGNGDFVGLPMPYTINPVATGSGPYKDTAFSLIFEQLLERYARKVGSEWQGNQGEYLQSYSNAIRANVSNIMGFEEVKQLISAYYDPGDYDNPNDGTTKSSLQNSLLNGVLSIYFRFYIMEYYCMLMPFYEVFKPYDGTATATSDKVIEFAQSYVMEKVKTDLKNAPVSSTTFYSIFNKTYDYIKDKEEFEVPIYTGNQRGMEFYINTNMEGTHQLFQDALDTSSLKKDKNNIIGGSFVYNTNLGLQTHEYAGIRTLTSDKQLGGDSAPNWTSNAQAGVGAQIKIICDFSSKPYSLFKGSRYKYFKNGMFFIQNYLVLEEINEPPFSEQLLGNSYADRKDYLKGVVNLEQIEQIHGMIIGKNSRKLNELFKNIRYGSRLCYGIAYDANDNDEGTDQNVKNFALDLFSNYVNDVDGVTSNSGKLTATMLDASANSTPFQKYIICADGANFKFTKKEGTSSPSSAILGPEHEPTPDGTFSVVIPAFSLEEESSASDMERTWQEFYNSLPTITSDTTISDIDKFKNLNAQLINSDKYKALLESCFPLKNMIHYNAIAGGQHYSKSQVVQNAFNQTKEAMVSAIEGVYSGKKTLK